MLVANVLCRIIRQFFSRPKKGRSASMHVACTQVPSTNGVVSWSGRSGTEEGEEGGYTPRQRLIEIDIAPILGVSRATLRAALTRHQFRVILVPGRKDKLLAAYRRLAQ
jgi:hypothetical protein